MGKERENPENPVDDLKKGIRNFGRENGHFFRKKLGAMSPPMVSPVQGEIN